jgi:hypothetical protein
MRGVSRSTISVLVRAGAQRDEVTGVLDGVLLVRVREQVVEVNRID